MKGNYIQLYTKSFADVILSVAKNLKMNRNRCFATLNMTDRIIWALT